MDSWRETTIGELANKVTKGSTPRKGKGFVESDGINYIKSDAVSYDGRVDISKFVMIDEQTHNMFKRSQLQENDILFSMAGAFLGKTGIVQKSMLPANTNQAIAIIRIDESKAMSSFIGYFLRIPKIINYVNNMSGQSAQPNINFEEIKSIALNLPALPEQKAIAEVLSSLDDKIDLLHQQNETLESMAGTLFREWFMEKDYEDLPLEDFVQINPKEKLSKGVRAVYLEMKNVETNTSCPSHWYDRGFKSGSKFRNGDAILARITPCLENGKKAYVQFLKENEIGWGSTEFLIFRTKDGFHPFIAYLLVANHEFKKFAQKSMTGSSGRQRVQTDSLWNFKLGKPTKDKIEELNQSFDSIAEKIKLNQFQIKTLKNLRDTLLPKLMSGEVRVKMN